MFRHVLVATDFGPASKRAAALAIDIAHKFGATLTLVHVCEIPALLYSGVPVDLITTPIKEGAREALDAELAEVRTHFPAATAVLRMGYAFEEVGLAVQESAADLLVIGTHGRRGLPRALLGSVAEKLVRTATVPVLTVHATASVLP